MNRKKLLLLLGIILIVVILFIYPITIGYLFLSLIFILGISILLIIVYSIFEISIIMILKLIGFIINNLLFYFLTFLNLFIMGHLKTFNGLGMNINSDKYILPAGYTLIEQPYYKGDAMHSVEELQELCKDFTKYCYQQAIIKDALIKEIKSL